MRLQSAPYWNKLPLKAVMMFVEALHGLNLKIFVKCLREMLRQRVNITELELEPFVFQAVWLFLLVSAPLAALSDQEVTEIKSGFPCRCWVFGRKEGKGVHVCVRVHTTRQLAKNHPMGVDVLQEIPLPFPAVLNRNTPKINRKETNGHKIRQ